MSTSLGGITPADRGLLLALSIEEQWEEEAKKICNDSPPEKMAPLTEKRKEEDYERGLMEGEALSTPHHW